MFEFKIVVTFDSILIVPHCLDLEAVLISGLGSHNHCVHKFVKEICIYIAVIEDGTIMHRTRPMRNEVRISARCIHTLHVYEKKPTSKHLSLLRLQLILF